MNQEPITNIGYDKLVKEIKYFKEVEIPAIVEDIRISASYGDLTENAEYEAATEKQGFLQTRLNELQQLLMKSVIVNPSQNSHDRIKFGSTFEIINIETEEKKLYTLVGGYESNPEKGLISYNSPLAKAFVNKELNEEVKVVINNNIMFFEIEEIYFDQNRLEQ